MNNKNIHPKPLKTKFDVNHLLLTACAGRAFLDIQAFELDLLSSLARETRVKRRRVAAYVRLSEWGCEEMRAIRSRPMREVRRNCESLCSTVNGNESRASELEPDKRAVDQVRTNENKVYSAQTLRIRCEDRVAVKNPKRLRSGQSGVSG